MEKRNYELYFGIGLVGVVCLALGFLIGSIYRDGGTMTERGTPYEISGLVDSRVMNSGGDEMGQVRDFVIDSKGHVLFTILSHDGKTVAVPFGAFHFNGEEKQIVLDVNKEKLESAPVYSRSDLENEKWTEDNYRHFGQQPFWTEPMENQEGAFEIPGP